MHNYHYSHFIPSTTPKMPFYTSSLCNQSCKLRKYEIPTIYKKISSENLDIQKSVFTKFRVGCNYIFRK